MLKTTMQYVQFVSLRKAYEDHSFHFHLNMINFIFLLWNKLRQTIHHVNPRTITQLTEAIQNAERSMFLQF